MDPYQELANGIVKSAVIDYRRALKAIKKNMHAYDAERTVKECEMFFRSQWFSILTEVNGNWLIERLQKEFT